MKSMLRLIAVCLLPLALVSCASSHSAAIETPPPDYDAKRDKEEAFAGDYVLLVGNLPDLIFGGVTRATAKTTMVTTSTITYSSITSVTSLTKPVVNSTSPRTGVENDQAKFSAWLYAYNLPADNDFHLILGDTSTYQSGVTNLINVEVSGRPNSSDTVFKAVRTAFLNKIGNPTTMAQSTYYCLATPIVVTVTGGPFWDTSHPSGGSGTSSCYGGTAMKTINGWELHPVTSIQ